MAPDPNLPEVALIGFAPSVLVSDNQHVDVPTAALQLEGSEPSVGASGNVTVSPSPERWHLEGFAPDVIIAPAKPEP